MRAHFLRAGARSGRPPPAPQKAAHHSQLAALLADKDAWGGIHGPDGEVDEIVYAAPKGDKFVQLAARLNAFDGSGHTEAYRLELLRQKGKGRFTKQDQVFSCVADDVMGMHKAANEFFGCCSRAQLEECLEVAKKNKDGGKRWKRVLDEQISAHARHAQSCRTPASYQTPASRAAQGPWNTTAGRAAQGARNSTPAGRVAQGERNSTPAGRKAQAARNSTPRGRAAQAKKASKPPSLDPKVQAERDRIKLASRKAREMKRLGRVNVAKHGLPAIWVPKADVEAAPEKFPFYHAKKTKRG